MIKVKLLQYKNINKCLFFLSCIENEDMKYFSIFFFKKKKNQIFSTSNSNYN